MKVSCQDGMCYLQYVYTLSPLSDNMFSEVKELKFKKKKTQTTSKYACAYVRLPITTDYLRIIVNSHGTKDCIRLIQVHLLPSVKYFFNRRKRGSN